MYGCAVARSYLPCGARYKLDPNLTLFVYTLLVIDILFTLFYVFFPFYSYMFGDSEIRLIRIRTHREKGLKSSKKQEN